MLGVVAVLLGLGLVVGLSVAASHDDVKLKGLGDREFRAGRVDELRTAISRYGPPLIPEPAGGSSGDIRLQHIGSTWYAIAAGRRGCTIVWNRATRTFTDPCTKATFPADGAGRTRFRTHVEDDTVYVDFRTTVP